MQKEKETVKKGSAFETFSSWVICATGSSTAFVVAIAFIVVWACTGPVFHYSDTWQLIVNTSTTIITFLMVFLIQKSQNKDSKSIQLKLNELISATKMANNKLIGAEDLTEHELDTMHRYYSLLAEQTRKRRANSKGEDPMEEELEQLKDAIEKKGDVDDELREAKQRVEARLKEPAAEDKEVPAKEMEAEIRTKQE